MRKAKEKLDKAQRKESLEEQTKAREELEQAKAELEEILRQLREEEIERSLVSLQTRFERMLTGQLRINESTERLSQSLSTRPSAEIEFESGRLAGDQSKIALDADRALELLKEDASTVALPTTIEMLRDDMIESAEKLQLVQLDSLTIGLQTDIVATIQEILDALDRAKKDQEKRKEKQKQSPPSQEEGEPGLVDQITELKTIRSQQTRINERTNRLSQRLANQDDPVGQAETADLSRNLQELSSRQTRLFEITREIVERGKDKRR